MTTRARLLVLGALALAFSSSCAARPDPRVTAVSPAPVATPRFVTYPIAAAFSPTGPPLSKDERAWIRHVMRLKEVAPHRTEVRFAFGADARLPVILYIRQPDQDGHDRGGHVLGGNCNWNFDPYERGFYPGPVCSNPDPR